MFENKNYNLIVIGGPTAVGKTSLSIELAKLLGGEIIGCDSMQIYKGMDIGSAKPTEYERKQVPHHLIDFADPKRDFSVAQYQDMGRNTILKLQTNGILPIISGGTGLYLSSLLYPLNFSADPKTDENLRKNLESDLLEYGKEEMYRRLEAMAPESARRLHPNNSKKVIRALEAAILGGEIEDFSREFQYFDGYKPLMICLYRNREELYNRINSRVEQLFDLGLVEEIRSLKEDGLREDHISMKGIGYKEIFYYLDGKISYEEAMDLIKKNTRHYAKRQLTWFKRYKDMNWINLSEKSDEEALKEIISLYSESWFSL